MIKTSKKRRIIVERIIPLSKANDDFNLRFWQRAGVLSRFSATWKMIEELYKIKGIHGYKLRLQRSVQNIQLNIIGKEELKKSKMLSPRPQDLLDLQKLRKLKS